MFNTRNMLNKVFNEGHGLNNPRYIFLGRVNGTPRWKYNWNHKPSKYKPHQGAEECARRSPKQVFGR